MLENIELISLEYHNYQKSRICKLLYIPITVYYKVSNKVTYADILEITEIDDELFNDGQNTNIFYKGYNAGYVIYGIYFTLTNSFIIDDLYKNRNSDSDSDWNRLHDFTKQSDEIAKRIVNMCFMERLSIQRMFINGFKFKNIILQLLKITS